MCPSTSTSSRNGPARPRPQSHNACSTPVSGPSGVGKSTLFGLLFERHPDTFTLSVSHTTRSPRSGEQHGIHYHFVTKDEFLALKAKDCTQSGGNYYGTSKVTIEEQTSKSRVVVLDIEMEGIKQIKATGFPARYVFIAPPSTEKLEEWLRERATDSEEAIQERLAQAKLELEYAKTPGVHDKIIVNKDQEEALEACLEFEGFVFAPELET